MDSCVTDLQILAELQTFKGRFSTQALNQIFDKALQDLQDLETQSWPPYTVDMFVQNWTLINGRIVYPAVSIIKQYRLLHGASLPRAKAAYERFVQCNEAAILEAIRQHQESEV